jgi:hypothetical protein
MIKIDIENIQEIKNEYFEGVKKLILDRINFYLIAFKIMDHQPGYSIGTLDNYAVIKTQTKTTYLKILGRSKKSISNKTHFKKLNDPNSLSKHYYALRTKYINLLNQLSNEDNLKHLILAEAEDLLKTQKLFCQSWFNGETTNFIKDLIPYDDFIKKETVPFNAYDLVNLLKVNVCPYCNRVYTNTIIGKGRKQIIRPTLDHYFLQSQYPLLGLSFYNLIPACHYCNSNLKGAIPFSLDLHMHPYIEGFGQDATFDYSQIAYYPDKSDQRNYEVVLKGNIHRSHEKHHKIFGDGIDPNTGNANVFKLIEIYQGHADVVGELIAKSDKNSPYYAANIVKMLASLGATKREFYRFYFANYLLEKDFNKRPLAKLTKDIVAKYLPELIE